MPKRTDLKSVLIIGAGPIIIADPQFAPEHGEERNRSHRAALRRRGAVYPARRPALDTVVQPDPVEAGRRLFAATAAVLPALRPGSRFRSVRSARLRQGIRYA